MLLTTQRFTLVALATLLVSGCFDSKPTTEQLCEEHANLQCQQLNMRDGQCLNQREALILSRFEVLKSQSDLDKLNTVKATYEYQKCLTSAAQIEPITAKEIKTKRSEALLHTYDAIDALSLELQTSTEPKVLFYRWTTGDKKALREFLQLEGTKALESAELQYALATFYTQRDGNKTILILNHSLELLTEKDYENELHSIIIKSLASINHKEGNKKHAYIWALVGKEFQLQVASEKQLELLYQFTAEEKETLLKSSETITKSIEAQNFHPSLLPVQVKK
ncbi:MULTISPECIES: DUF2989 domain-containing protein [Aliivibrio]|uniref:DUF2989 domain-containing protein n=1 Tax=Aliivibrio finisterrensis TaxID=511998 RepID=A0A4V1Z8R3_9GAMM|nr:MULTISPECIES: DUF2989 domain-containing protein [Aliivibrio]MDD9179464.1 DUF2989 domain-containing protein [Aliivibrio sp. A6]RYU50921.1 DUF2989 domain-containing protein [Aliivibrio finisterrensis]RYU51622.1 DUF2989 domain-containing protein [Aliivibrio finisterrensis]RYU57432.1 DUF2989 domain-containing protein [Aliivibrio finisterrensis]RYU63943.1 DUF2989 domain-containing protein [Aliivibrio finisterrensis]